MSYQRAETQNSNPWREEEIMAVFRGFNKFGNSPTKIQRYAPELKERTKDQVRFRMVRMGLIEEKEEEQGDDSTSEDNASHNYNLRKKVGKKRKMARKDLVTKLQETLDYVTGKKRPLEADLGIPKSKFPRNDWVCLYPYWRISMGEIVYFLESRKWDRSRLELNHEQRLTSVEFNIPLPSFQEIHLFSDKLSTLISQLQLQKQQVRMELN